MTIPDDELLALWCAGFDTYEISRMAGIPESEVANRLPKIREWVRQNKDYFRDKQERKERARERRLVKAKARRKVKLRQIHEHDPLLASLVEHHGDAA